MHDEGAALAARLGRRKKDPRFEADYQGWYSCALPVVKMLAPDRCAEFKAYYEADQRRKWLDHETWAVQDYFTGNEPTTHSHCEFDCAKETRRRIQNQLAIFKSLDDRVGWRLLDMEDELRVELYASELKAARALIKISPRAAGTLAGVVLEGYLRKLVRKHRAKPRRREHRIRDLDDAPKEAGLFDAQVWAQVSWLGEVGERCAREDQAEPTPFQVRDLIDGTGWLIKNVF